MFVCLAQENDSMNRVSQENINSTFNSLYPVFLSLLTHAQDLYSTEPRQNQQKVTEKNDYSY